MSDLLYSNLISSRLSYPALSVPIPSYPMLSHLISSLFTCLTYLPIYRSTNLSIYLSIYLSVEWNAEQNMQMSSMIRYTCPQSSVIHPCSSDRSTSSLLFKKLAAKSAESDNAADSTERVLYKVRT